MSTDDLSQFLEDLDDQLPRIFCDLMGIPTEWGDKPRKFRQGTALATLDVFADSALGIDDVIYEDVAGSNPSTIRATVIGQRQFTLQVSVWSRSQRLHKQARKYLSRLRTRLRLPSTLETFRILGIAHVRTEGLVDQDPSQDGRIPSRSIMDVVFAHSVSERDAEIATIETVRVSAGTTDQPDGPGLGITDPDGTPSPLQPDQTIPEP